MTDNIEQKALALVNKVGVYYYPSLGSASMRDLRTALCRAIEQQEAFRQEVSDAVEGFYNDNPYEISCYCDDLKRFIIAKPDPLVEAIREMALTDATPEDADRLRAALATRGLEIREKQP